MTPRAILCALLAGLLGWAVLLLAAGMAYFRWAA